MRMLVLLMRLFCTSETETELDLGFEVDCLWGAWAEWGACSKCGDQLWPQWGVLCVTKKTLADCSSDHTGHQRNYEKLQSVWEFHSAGVTR